MRIVGAMVVGGGEFHRYLAESLTSMLKVCDRVVVALNNVDTHTYSYVAARDRVVCYMDNREWGKHQHEIKESLHEKIAQLKPDWVMTADADEIVDPELTREKLEALAAKGEVAYNFYIVNLWNDEAHCYPPLSFWKVLLYKYDPALGVRFAKQPLHCGLVPLWAAENAGYAPYVHTHYGLMKAEDRSAKVRRYDKYDPEAKYKGKSYYETLKLSIHYVEPFDIEAVRQKVAEDVARYKRTPPKQITMAENKEFYVRRTRDGVILPIPENNLQITINRRDPYTGAPEFELIGEVGHRAEEAPVVSGNPPASTFKCVIHGKEFPTENGLKTHQRIMQCS